MGEFAVDATERLRTQVAERLDAAWETEASVAGTPVDVLGRVDERVIATEAEWRRADPVNNTAKLFRHLVGGELDTEHVLAVQVFTRYYDLESGDVSTKRVNAKFVGRVAADAVDRLSYRALTLDIDPPKRGGARPVGWPDAVDRVAERVGSLAIRVE